MSREIRSSSERRIHHVTSRGNNLREIFTDDLDRKILLECIQVVADRYSWDVLAYCLMNNHIHLLTEAADRDLSQGCRDALGAYARRFHRRHGSSGHLFGRRFHSVAAATDEQLLAVVRYIAMNPVRAGIVSRPEDWEWSSYQATITQAKPHACLNLTRLWGLIDTSPVTARARLRVLIDTA